MDVNNTRWFLYRDRADFANASTRLAWHPGRRALTLAPNQVLWLPASDPDEALAAWSDSRPLALDAFGQLARIGDAGDVIECNGGQGWAPLRDGELDPVLAPAGRFVDLALGAEGRLAAAWTDGLDHHGLLVFHLGRRWQSGCELPVAPRRVWVDDMARLWCIGSDRLMCCSGEPLPLPYLPDPARFEPLTINPRPLRLDFEQPLPDGLSALALTADADRLFILCHDGEGRQSILTRPLGGTAERPFARFDTGIGVPFAIDVGRLSSTRLALLSPRPAADVEFTQRDCAVVDLLDGSAGVAGEARLLRERYPMLSLAVPRFVASADRQLRYPADADADAPAHSPRPRLLVPLARPAYRLEASSLLTRVLDSGQPDTVWHRIYLDACIPRGCSIRIGVRVFDAPAQRGSSPVWLQPPPVWSPLSSELPFADGIAERIPGESGLFELLIQRPDGPVRRISGRYLQLQLRFQGNGRETPSLHALRVYFPRLSWQEAYLPEFFRQEQQAHDDAVGPANGADVRERLLASFEGMLTPVEGRVAASDQLVHPDSAPPALLAGLAAAIGVRLPTHWPLPRQRRLLRKATLVQQWRGTLAGLNLALDIATDGAVQRGEVVALENFRLRRTLATVLGIDMDDRDHPLTLGTGMSGNSLIGDTLILAEADVRNFLALFSPALASAPEREQVEAFFAGYANQVSILLHGAGARLRATVEEVLRAEMPAHVRWRVIETEHPFVLGVSPLLAIDTFVETAPPPQPVVLDDTRLGHEGSLRNPAAFSPHELTVSAGPS